jgi:hypothetical protein
MGTNGIYVFTLQVANSFLGLYLDVSDSTQNYVELRDFLSNLNYTLQINSNVATLVI